MFINGGLILQIWLILILILILIDTLKIGSINKECSKHSNARKEGFSNVH